MDKLKQLIQNLISKKNEKIILISGGVFIILVIGVLVFSLSKQKPKETNSQPTQTVEENEVIVEEISNIDLSALPLDDEVREPIQKAFNKLLEYDQITYKEFGSDGDEVVVYEYSSTDFKRNESVTYYAENVIFTGCTLSKYSSKDGKAIQTNISGPTKGTEHKVLTRDELVDSLINRLKKGFDDISNGPNDIPSGMELEKYQVQVEQKLIDGEKVSVYTFKRLPYIEDSMIREVEIILDSKGNLKRIVVPYIYSYSTIDIVGSKVMDNFDQELSTKQINKNLVSQDTINKVQDAFNKLKQKSEFMITEKASSISEIGDKDYVMTKTIQNVPEKKSTVYGLSWEGVEDEYQRNGIDYFDNLSLVENYLMKFLTGKFDENMIKYLKVTEKTSTVNIKGTEAIQIDLEYSYSVNDHPFCVELNGGNVNTISITISKNGDLISIKNMPNPYTEDNFISHGRGHRENINIFFDYGEELLKPISGPVRR